ncbi:MAG: hypothetical protein NVS9B3_14480 [Gemmatimonadaceae bacterium]
MKTCWGVGALALGAIACASRGGARSTATRGRAAPPGNAPRPVAGSAVWPVKTREHVDLWLHSYALLQADTTKIPFFHRGYRDQQVVLKNRANVLTLLDANREKLAARFAVNRALVNGQFLPLYFGTFDEMRQVIASVLEAEGDVRRINRAYQPLASVVAGSFPSPADRDWLRLFMQSLTDESAKWYHQYWLDQQRSRAPALAAVDSLWQQVYRPRLQRFLNNTRQPNGDVFLSLPLDGEGRTVQYSARENAVTVSFPEQRSSAIEAIYVIVHEIVGPVANQVVADNTTPAEKRDGRAERFAGAALVRAGELLLAQAAPELVDGYARFYLRSAGVSAAGDARAHLAREFPIPDLVRDGIARQIDVVLGGI